MTRTVDILVFPAFQLLDATGPLQVFASANDWSAARGAPAPYRIRTIAASSPVTSSAGLSVNCGRLPSPSRPVDTLIVSGGRGVHAAADDGQLVRWLEARARFARRVVSICSGAFLLAAAGILRGRHAATHWSDCAALADRHPDIKVEPDPIFVRDGNVWTSAGVTAGIDLSLALVESDLGHEAATAIARDLVVFMKRSGGQAQFSDTLLLQGDNRFGELNSWIVGHLREPLDIPTLAARAGMSERSFIRHFRGATGVTPARAVERMRVEAARQLLATTRRPIKSIALRCGFGAAETMRRAFLRQIGATPQSYRAGFGRVEIVAGSLKKSRTS